MISTQHRLQLIIFAVVSGLAVTYSGLHIFGFQHVFSPPYRVTAEFATSGGIYPRADVDLLGTRVGTVDSVEPGPDGGTRVVLAIDHGVKVPGRVTAAVTDKSAIGEQYVELAPSGSSAGVLRPGDDIPRSRTRTPIPVDHLLADLNTFAGSVPLDDLHTVLHEGAKALNGVGPTLGQLIDNSDRLTAATRADAQDFNALVDNAATTLDTQVELTPQIVTDVTQAAGLLHRTSDLAGPLLNVFQQGTTAGAQVTNLLANLRSVLPLVLGNLGTIVALLADRVPQLRKAFTVLPWALQYLGDTSRYCDHYRASGDPVQSTCHYDDLGRPLYSTHFALQIPEAPGSQPYLPCTKGYEQTRKYLPNGAAADGQGTEDPNETANPDAGCTAAPNDPDSPNVRGAQNVH